MTAGECAGLRRKFCKLAPIDAVIVSAPRMFAQFVMNRGRSGDALKSLRPKLGRELAAVVLDGEPHLAELNHAGAKRAGESGGMGDRLCL